MKIKMALAVTLASVLVLCTACSGTASSTEESSATTQNENTVVTPEETQTETTETVTVTADDFRSFPETDVSCFNYVTMDDGIQITGCSNIPGGVIVVPASINSLPVVSIGYGALGLNEAVAVVLPDTVKTIVNNAFNSSYVQYVELGSGVEYIGDMAFGSCSNLVELTTPAGSYAEQIATANGFEVVNN